MNDLQQSRSLALYEQAEYAAFKFQAFRPCTHLWEKQDEGIWQCEVCDDVVDLGLPI